MPFVFVLILGRLAAARQLFLVEVGRAWARARPTGLDFLLNKTLNPTLGLGPKPNFFINVVPHEPKLSPTYLINFSSPKKPEPEKIRPDPPLVSWNQNCLPSETPIFDVSIHSRLFHFISNAGWPDEFFKDAQNIAQPIFMQSPNCWKH
jgi:hypothetical protein